MHLKPISNTGGPQVLGFVDALVAGQYFEDVTAHERAWQAVDCAVGAGIFTHASPITATKPDRGGRKPTTRTTAGWPCREGGFCNRASR
jgi:hypothetical protein